MSGLIDYLSQSGDVQSYRRQLVQDVVKNFVFRLNSSYYQNTPFLRAWPTPIYLRKMKYSLPVAVVALLLYFVVPKVVNVPEWWLKAMPVVTILGCAWFVSHFMQMIGYNRWEDGSGPFYVELHTIGAASRNELRRHEESIPPAVFHVVNSFLSDVPGGVAHVGVLYHLGAYKHPTSIRLVKEEEEVTIWVMDHLHKQMAVE